MWLTTPIIFLVASISVWAVIAKRIGSRFPLFLLVIVSIFNFAALIALIYLFNAPTKSGLSMEQREAQVYAFAEIAVALIILLLLFLPPTLLLWLVRLRNTRKVTVHGYESDEG